MKCPHYFNCLACGREYHTEALSLSGHCIECMEGVISTARKVAGLNFFRADSIRPMTNLAANAWQEFEEVILAFDKRERPKTAAFDADGKKTVAEEER